MTVGVVVPARDAEQTLAETLASLRGQRFPDWEAVVVDDGSRDGTLALARSVAERDARIRVVNGPAGGPSAARNAGIAATSAALLLFLDADDWIAPGHLETLVAALGADRSLDAVYCRWARVTPEGESVPEGLDGGPEGLAAAVRTGCPFAIHCCLVPRALVLSVGGFDPGLRTCEDWDLWQRIVRAGARFGAVDQVLAYYRMRPASLSLDHERLLRDGFRVIDRGHSADPRIPVGPGRDAPRVHPGDLEAARLGFLCWVAGIALGGGADARPLLDTVASDGPWAIHPERIAHSIFWGALPPECLAPAGWDDLWPRAERRVDAFLLALEDHTRSPGLARRTRRVLEGLLLGHSAASRPRTIDATHAVRTEMTRPIEDLAVPAGVERVRCEVTVDGELLGDLDLPVAGRCVPAYVLADAVAAEFAWLILGALFASTVYRGAEGAPDPDGVRRWRGCVLPDDLRRLHDAIGWCIFLQEIWERPDWPTARFYDGGLDEGPTPRRDAGAEGRLPVEVGEDLCDVDVPGGELAVEVRAGGVGLGTVSIVAENGRLSAQAVRAAVTTATGFELCVAVVREALLGKPLAGETSLRQRLADATQRAGGRARMSAGLPDDPVLAPDCYAAVGRALGAGEGGIVIGRRAVGTIPSRVSRRAALPAGSAPVLVQSARLNGEPVVEVAGPAAGRVTYAPDLLWRPPGGTAPRAAAPARPGVRGVSPPYVRHDFEKLFARRADPWHYTSEYERLKYEQTLSLLPAGPIARALEIGCAEGHFTAELALRVERLVAADISEVALGRAQVRAAGAGNVEFLRLDVRQDPLPGSFDLVVCSEMLYYLGDRETLGAVAARIAEALRPGGHLVTAHAILVDEEPDQPGFDWDAPFGATVVGEAFGSLPALRFVTELRTVPYRIQVFRRDGLPAAEGDAGGRSRGPETVVHASAGAMAPDVAAHLVERPSRPRSRAADVTTERLPVLMYHRVAGAGPAATARYRVTPEAFEAQLRYLRDSGFHGVDLEDWIAALEARRPLPGRAVVLTFDDGYRDFATCAWPLLERYGFGATVFLVADLIGGTNRWDAGTGDEVPLLDWDEVDRLHRQGVRFGSHSATHAPLTALSPAEVVREAAGSRVTLERGLGVPVTAFAYPYGDADRVVEHLVGACGYVIGASCRPGRSGPGDAPLSLPRIEITGLDRIEEFALKLDV